MTEEQVIKIADEIFGPAGYDIGGDSPSLQQLMKFAAKVLDSQATES